MVAGLAAKEACSWQQASLQPAGKPAASKLAASVQATSHKPLHLQATSSHRYCTDSHPPLAHMPRQRLWLCSAWHCQPFLPTPARCDVGWKNCESSLLCHVNPINKPACQNPRRHPHVAHGLESPWGETFQSLESNLGKNESSLDWLIWNWDSTPCLTNNVFFTNPILSSRPEIIVRHLSDDC